MKEYKDPMDEFFRETLQDHRLTPSEKAKMAFMKDVMQNPSAEKRGRKGLILLSVLLFLAVTGLFIWANSSDQLNPALQGAQVPATINPASANQTTLSPANPSASPAPEQSVSVVNNIKSNIAKPEVVTIKKTIDRVKATTIEQSVSFNTTITTETTNSASTSAETATAEITTAEITTSETTTSETTIAETTITNSSNDFTSPAMAAAATTSTKTSKPEGSQGKSEEPGETADSVTKKTDTSTQVSSGKLSGTDREPANNQNPWIPSIGLYYTPEWMFNTLEDTKFINNFGLEGTIQYGRFSVRTGVGISVGKGTHEVVVEYNDFLGTYNKLDSMDFTWNDPIHNYVPTMYISKQDVWDSLMKLDYAKVVKRYTYLQIPLILGYDFWQSERVAIGFRTGPVLSVLLTSKQLSEVYDPGSKKIISVNDIAPDQINLNWQIMAGINTTFLLSKKLRFEVEPSVKYYFNSVYEKPVNNTKPWSVGIRAAFVVDF